MTKQLLSLILSGCILISLSAIGQNAEYPTKKVNGIEYYIYTVQPSEGMFSISRRFGVKQADINNANPQIQDGLKAGMQILVPVTAENKKHIQKSVNKTVTTTGPEFIQHKVEKKQTLFAISRLYNVSQEDIKKYNPEAEKGLREGMILQIPKAAKESQKPVENAETIKYEKPSEQVSNTENKNYIIHVVQANETLYSISKKYNVDIVAITQLNPGSATSIGLGTCCVGSFNEKDIKIALKIPENFEVLVMLAVGYPGDHIDLSSKLLNIVQARKSLSDVASEEMFGKRLVPQKITEL